MKKHLIILFIAAVTFTSANAMAQSQTFDNVCQDCHTGGFKGWISGAPDVRYPEEWKPFIERDTLLDMQQIVLKGSGDHKVKGGCKSCSEQDVLEAIDHMMSKVK